MAYLRIRSVVVLIILTVIVGCKEKSKTMGESGIAARGLSVSELKERVYKGDVEAYNDLYTVYFSDQNEDLLYWSMIMANKYDYGPAYYDVFNALTFWEAISSSNYGLKSLDTKTKVLALSYLKVAVDKNVEDAVKVWKDVSSADSAITNNFKGVFDR